MNEWIKRIRQASWRKKWQEMWSELLQYIAYNWTSRNQFLIIFASLLLLGIVSKNKQCDFFLFCFVSSFFSSIFLWYFVESYKRKKRNWNCYSFHRLLLFDSFRDEKLCFSSRWPFNRFSIFDDRSFCINGI